MKTNISLVIKFALSISTLISTFLFAEYQYPSYYREPTGNLLYAEHFTKAWCRGVQNGVDGPSKQVIQGRTYFCSDRYGNYYFVDMLNQQIWKRDTAGIVRVIAGTGEHGFRDGPAAQAKFFMSPVGGGYDTYNGIKCDDSGRVYVSDNQNNRLRMVHRKPDGRWWVSTVSGSGTLQPNKGQWINAMKAKWGCAPQFGILPDGSAAYYVNYGGIWKVQINHELPESSQVTRLMTAEELTAAGIGGTQWKSASHITPDSQFFWSPGDPSTFLKFDEPKGTAELWAGSFTHGACLDNTGWRLDARWHTHEWASSVSGKVMFTGGGDEWAIRRIYQDTVKHILANGTYGITNGSCTGGGRVHWVDHKGHLFFTPSVSEGNLLTMRATFENTDTTESWETEPWSVKSERKNLVQPGSSSLHVFPNPFHGVTLFHYQSLRNTKTPGLSVYNCRGELVKSFKISCGEGDVVWNGRDELGRTVAGGYYFAVLKSGENRMVRKVMNLR